MIAFSGINKQYGRQVLFVDASFQLNRVLELGGENGADIAPHAYQGSYVDSVARTGHEAPGVHT